MEKISLTRFRGSLKITFCTSFLLTFFHLSHGQNSVVKDINHSLAGQTSTDFCECGVFTYFIAANELGSELWRSDGTPNGTAIVRDILPGFSSGAAQTGFSCLNGTLIFAASDGMHGTELWKTDGTFNGTMLLKDIAEGSETSIPSTFVRYNDKIFFSAYNAQYVTELWVSDGTTAGTLRVASLGTTAWTQILHIGVYADGIYFTQRTGDGLYQLWLSDGTTDGTKILHSSPWLYEVLGVGDKIYFAESINNEQFLWISDGTVAGSSVVKSFPSGSFPQSFYSFDDKLFFNANGVYVSDGTDAGTINLLNGRIEGGTTYKGKFFGVATGGDIYPNYVFSSDGSSLGTEVVMNLGGGYSFSLPHAIPVLNNKIIIPMMSDAEGVEPAISDGTSVNTYLLKDIAQGSKSSEPTSMEVSDNKLYFLADDGIHGKEFWVSDGTSAGTVLLKDCRTGTESSSYYDPTLVEANGSLLFLADENFYGPKNLWRSDGTESGTVLEKDFDAYPVHLGMMGTDAVYIDSHKLYRSTGRPHETSLLVDLLPIIGEGYSIGLNDMFELNGKYVFYLHTASSKSNLGGEFWTTDGTSDGTNVLKDINPGPATGIGNRSGVVIGNKYLFAAQDGTSGFELWITDGTAEETKMVKDIQPGSVGSSPNSFTLFKGEAYFAADDGLNGTGLWKSNGTADGTVMVKSFAPSTNPLPGNLTTVGDVMIFSAFDEINGWAIWRTDGTNANTTMVRDIHPSKNKHNALLFFKAMEHLVYFSGDDGVHGREPWVTDGTADGTDMLLDIVPGVSSSFPKSFSPVGDNLLYFCAAGKLWKTNGSSTYTSVAADAEPLGNLVFMDEWIYYLGVSKDHGMELFKAKHEWLVTGVEFQEKANVIIFPVPVGNTLNIQSQLNEDVHVAIVDLLGVVRSSFALPLDSTVPHDVSQLSTGLYIATIKGRHAYESIKFFKE